ncbi:hypothetical protein ABZ234_18385 [Nocardiopsis sp. NPDC006198]
MITTIFAVAGFTLAVVRCIQDNPKVGKGRHAIGHRRKRRNKR